MVGLDAFKANLGGVTITQKHINEAGLGDAHNITLCDAGFTSWTVVHELAHAWDGANDWQLSKSMETSLGSGFDHPLLHTLSPKDPRYWWDPGQGPPPCGVDGGLNRLEDFAESITAYVYPTEASKRATARGWPYVDKARGYSYSSYLDTPRGLYIGARFGFTP
jgi:hypothetical protein